MSAIVRRLRRPGKPLVRALALLLVLVPLAAASIAEAAAAKPARSTIFEFLSPQDGELLIGATRFRFAVANPVVDRIDVFFGGRLIGTAKAPAWSFDWHAPSGRAPTEVRALAYGGGRVLEQASIRTADVSFTDAVEVLGVQLYPVVTDRSGRYINDLGVGAFELYENGKRIQIDAFSAERAPLHLTILIDVSLSMRDNLPVVQDAAVEFLGQIVPGDEISVYGFHHGLLPLLRRGSSPDQAKIKVQQLSAGGGTALYDALLRVLDDLTPAAGSAARSARSGSPDRRAILLFSDGKDGQSLATQAAVIEKARASDVLIYAIATGSQRTDLMARDDLKLLATDTGGELHVAEKLKELPDIFARIARDLASQYRLAFTPPLGAKGQRQIEVRLTQPDLRVRSRQSYYVP